MYLKFVVYVSTSKIKLEQFKDIKYIDVPLPIYLTQPSERQLICFDFEKQKKIFFGPLMIGYEHRLSKRDLILNKLELQMCHMIWGQIHQPFGTNVMVVIL